MAQCATVDLEGAQAIRDGKDGTSCPYDLEWEEYCLQHHPYADALNLLSNISPASINHKTAIKTKEKEKQIQKMKSIFNWAKLLSIDVVTFKKHRMMLMPLVEDLGKKLIKQ